MTNGNNPKNVPVRFEIREGDTVLDTVTLGAGQSADDLAGLFGEDSGDHDIVLVAIPQNGSESVLDSATVGSNCVEVEPAVVQPEASVDADCDGVVVTLDNSGSDEAVTYTVVINGESQDVTVPAGETDTATGDLRDNGRWNVTVSVGANELLAEGGA